MTASALPYPAHLESLTALRFFAALTVALYHMALIPPSLPDWLAGIEKTGHMAVDYFFVLSGFILMHVYGRTFATQVGVGERNAFFAKRFARLYPLHLTMLLVSALLFILGFGFGPFSGGDRFSLTSFLAHLLMLNAWFGQEIIEQFNIPSWSVSAEFALYLLFPYLCLLLHRVGRRTGLVLAMLGLLYLWGLFTFFLHQPFFFLPYKIFPEFVLGMSLYRFQDKRPLRCPPGQAATLLMTVLVLAMLVGMPEIIILTLFVAILIWAAETERAGSGMWLKAPFLVYMGKLSYSFYLAHYPIMTLILRLSAGMWGEEQVLVWYPLVVTIMLAVTLGVAVMLHEYVEKPLRSRIVKGLAARNFP